MPAKKPSPNNMDQPVRQGRKAAQGTGGFATPAERKAIIKEAERVFGKGGFQLTKSTQRSTVNKTPKLTAISKTAKSDVNTKSVYASTRAYSSFNPLKKPVKVSTYMRDKKAGGGPASRKK
jgi:hypothetical protein